MTAAKTEVRWEFAERLASWFCHRYSLRRSHREDVLQDMLVAMADAATRFDQMRGIPFEAFARKRMFGEAISGLERRGGVPRYYWAKGVRCAIALAGDVSKSPTVTDPDNIEEVIAAIADLNRVSPVLADVVRSTYIENENIAAIATSYGLTETAINGIARRGLRLLRDRTSVPKYDHSKECPMQTGGPNATLSVTQWRNEIRSAVKRLMTPAIIEQIVATQIGLAKRATKHALNFLLKWCDALSADTRSVSSRKHARNRERDKVTPRSSRRNKS